ncbi:glycosyltransferase [Pseudomonas taetrolens]|uniref:glycosyltransferase n=1 Tax=Pseudomonas taetrolens TaxID=47884 RepID=UPI0030DC7479
MKILYIITGLGVGGAERQVLDLADQFAGQGHTVKICYLVEPVLLRPKHDSVELLGVGLEKSASGFVKGIVRLRAIIKAFAPDVVHAHMVHANLFSRMVRLICPINKLINTAHNTNEGGQARMLAYRLTHGLADVTTNVTQEAVRVFEQKKACPVGTMRAISNGIDTEVYKPDSQARFVIREENGVSEDDRVILAVGRLMPAKDYENLVHAFNDVARESDNVRLWIVGDGIEKQKILDLVGRLKLANKISFLGVRSDVAKIYNAADMYVLSSAWEGFGLVVAEAMATEKVVVATDCGGVKEVVGDCGYLVPIKDPVALGAAMKNALLLSPDEKIKLGAAARARIIQNYSLTEIVNVWHEIYTS